MLGADALGRFRFGQDGVEVWIVSPSLRGWLEGTTLSLLLADILEVSRCSTGPAARYTGAFVCFKLLMVLAFSLFTHPQKSIGRKAKS
jgi:hypothetical protein